MAEAERSGQSHKKHQSHKPRRKVEKMHAVIVDSGAYTIKAGHSLKNSPTIIPNCIMKAKSERKRLFIGNQISECRDCSGLYYLLPCERGYITKWDVQKPVWDYTFSKNVCPINENPVIMTQPLFNFKSIQDCMDEIFYEEYEAPAMLRCNPTDMARFQYMEDHRLTDYNPILMIDTGFSFTHIIPYIMGNKYLKAVKRLNVGGKLLTNHLKDIISYRQYNVMEETYVINQVKEDTCYVAEDAKAELKLAEKHGKQNNIVKNYVLPDFNNIRRGYIQDPDKVDEMAENCQILRLNNERFLVPEILFHPSDIGMKSMGIAEAVVSSIMACPERFQAPLARNIVIMGGNCKFPGFKDRLYKELRSLLNQSWKVHIYQPEDPISYAWQAHKPLLTHPHIKNLLVTKKEYEELGSTLIQKRFDHWNNSIVDKPEARPVPESIEIDEKDFSRDMIANMRGKSVFGKQDPYDISDEPLPRQPTAPGARIIFNLGSLLTEVIADPPQDAPVPDPVVQFAESIEKNATKTNLTPGAILAGAPLPPTENENTAEPVEPELPKKIKFRRTSEELALEAAQEEELYQNALIFPFGRNSYI